MEIVAISFIIVFSSSYGVGTLLLEKKRSDDIT